MNANWGGGHFQSTYLGGHPESVRLHTKGRGVKISENSTYVLCAWPHKGSNSRCYTMSCYRGRNRQR